MAATAKGETTASRATAVVSASLRAALGPTGANATACNAVTTRRISALQFRALPQARPFVQYNTVFDSHTTDTQSESDESEESDEVVDESDESEESAPMLQAILRPRFSPRPAPAATATAAPSPATAQPSPVRCLLDFFAAFFASFRFRFASRNASNENPSALSRLGHAPNKRQAQVPSRSSNSDGDKHTQQRQR